MIRSDPVLAAPKFHLEWTRHMKMSFLIIKKKKITLSQQFYYQTLIFSFTLSYLFARHLKDFHELIIVININSKRSWSLCVKSKDC